MLNIGNKSINLGFALGLTEEEFRGHYAPIFKTEAKLTEAWNIVKSQKDASVDRSVEEPTKPELRRHSKKGRNEGVHNSAESESDIH